MITSKKFILSLIFVIINNMCVSSQVVDKNQDSLKHSSYDFLINKMGDTNNNALRIKYCRAYIRKARTEKDTSNIIQGYDLLAYFNKGFYKLKLLDSVIFFSKITNDLLSLTQATLEKGTEYYNLRKFSKALDYYVEANNFSKEMESPELDYAVRHGLGILKLRLGNYEDALAINQENLMNLKNSSTYFSKTNELNTLFALSSAHKNLNNLNLSTYYNKKGINLAWEEENSEMYNLFVLQEGTVQFLRNNTDAALDSIRKALPYFESRKLYPDLAFAYFYLGKIYREKNDMILAINYLSKVDTIFQKTGDINPELASTYQLLSNFYKSKDDLKNQLNYLNKFIALDSVLNDYQSYVDEGIRNNFDLPKLLKERDDIIFSLEKKASKLSYVIASAIIIIISGFFILRFRQMKLKTKFENLLDSKVRRKEEAIERISIENKKSEIPQHIEKKILLSLEYFEQKNGFTNCDLTLTGLAKTIKTNSNYLSKTINNNKGKNFATYINDLRLEFALEKLKISEKLRSFKITAISKEVGFNNAETFSKLFKKKNGIYPSYFIKQINKKSK